MNHKSLNNKAAEIDSKGNISYTKNINNNARLDIIIGLPGSGKSSNLVIPISAKYGSRIIDNDFIKEHIPEYNDGWGASVVHKESQIIEYDVIDRCFQNKENIVLPKVGSDYDKLVRLTSKAKENGYDIYLHYIKLSKEKALGRIINRFLETGRFLEPELIEKYVNKKNGDLVDQTFEKIKHNKLISGYSKWDGDVDRNKPLKCLESKQFDLFDNIKTNSRRKNHGR